MKYSREQVMGSDRDSFKYRAFISMLSNAGFASKDNHPKEWEDLHTLQEFDFEIKLQGVEIDYIKFIERYSNVFEMDPLSVILSERDIKKMQSRPLEWQEYQKALG